MLVLMSLLIFYLLNGVFVLIEIYERLLVLGFLIAES
jgi:hypothetical protein